MALRSSAATLSFLVFSLCVPSAAIGSAETKRLLQTYRTTKDVAKQQAAFDQLIESDEKTIALLHRTITALLTKQRAAYLRLFGSRAVRLSTTRAKSIPADQVRALRAEVLALGGLGDQLTKELLQQKAVPALEALRKLLMIDPREVLESDAKLTAQRERVVALANQLRRCDKALASLDPKVEPLPAASPEEQLADDERAALIQSLPISSASKATFAANAKRAARLDPRSVAAMRQCNLTRALLGLRVLSIDPRLMQAAKMHSEDMAKHDFFDHMSPVPGRKTPSDRARLARTTASGENIFMSTRPISGAQVNENWFVSPHHHIVMLADHLRIGVGRHENHFTEMFGR
ncbi:MAG: CAP domain-containing protein [Pirellulales bacterium]|nr:CAP domain-containing protein [Pirellulales bacterium]